MPGPLIQQQPFTFQPSVVPTIATSNPITRGLLEAVLPIGGVMVAVKPFIVAGGAEVFSDTAAPTIAALVPGIGKKYNGSSQFSSRNTVPTPLNLSQSNINECSVLTIAVPTAIASTVTRIFGYYSSASGNQGLNIRQGATASNVSFSVGNAAGGSQEVQSGTTNLWANNFPAVVVGTRSEILNFHRVYVDGQQLNTAAATAMGSVTTFDRTAIGAKVSSSNTQFWAGSVLLGATWNRALTPSEVASLGANPWQIFEAPPHRLWGQSTSSTISGDGAAAGTSTVLAVSADTAAEVGNSTGTSTVSGIGASANNQAGSSTGTSAVAATSAAAAAEVGNAAGTSTADAANGTATVITGDGLAEGTSTTFATSFIGGGVYDGGGGHLKRLPYGWWADPEYVPSLKKKTPLKEIEKEIVREAIEEVREESGGMAATLLANLVEPYTTNERIDWQAINRVGQEIQALRQAIAAYRKEQQEEAEDEEAILLLAH